jgi:MoxR-like ATPase
MAKNKKSQTVDLAAALKLVRQSKDLVGRTKEAEILLRAILAGRSILIEGPVGAGKTLIAKNVAKALGRSVVRIDGDQRFTEQKMVGSFDPSLALKGGFNRKSFVPGPLVEAMECGAILFINELNRMPEAVQNVLLPSLDEGIVQIPQIGEVKAEPGFLVVATQNPKEFVGTSNLSEALLDRLEWFSIDYQTFDEESEIVKANSGLTKDDLIFLIVALVRKTRTHPSIKRGASVRAAISMAKILATYSSESLNDESIINAAMLALPTRIELLNDETGVNKSTQFREILKNILIEVKKKT